MVLNRGIYYQRIGIIITGLCRYNSYVSTGQEENGKMKRNASVVTIAGINITKSISARRKNHRMVRLTSRSAHQSPDESF